ncbi:MAG: hypothetical protein CBC35_01420 [Planctomycetes bacterium TMED75]|nr:MAG: hypothetical protein CBC35_01420 [Planctomycetes bacterium TMED75]
MLTLSIIIVNWNSKNYVRKCLKSIQENGDSLATQVIVVDGGSFDGCDEMINNEFSWVEFVQANNNIGFGQSNNLGATKASGEYLLLLNPDTELKPGALNHLVSSAIRSPELGIMGARLLNSDGTLQTSSVHALPTPLNQFLDSELARRIYPKSSFFGTAKAYSSQKDTEVEAVSGACMLIRSSLFNDIGGFSSCYFMYAEDMDLCFKTRKAGLRNYHCPACEIIHHGGGSSSQQFSKFSTVHMCESLNRYLLINHGSSASNIYKFLTMLNAFIRLPLLTVWYFSSLNNKHSSTNTSIKRWLTIIRWTIGLEDWACKTKFKPTI